MPRLRKVSPQSKGWRRRRAGKGFVYLDENGARLVPPTSSGSGRWRSRRRGTTSGSARCPRATSRPWAPTSPGAASTSTTLTGGSSRTRRSSTGSLAAAAQLPAARRRILRDLGPRACPRTGGRHRRPPARPRLLPDRQRHLHRGQRLVRPHHPRAPARAAPGRDASSSTSSASRASSTPSRSTTPRRSRPSTGCARRIGEQAAAGLPAMAAAGPTSTAADGQRLPRRPARRRAYRQGLPHLARDGAGGVGAGRERRAGRHQGLPQAGGQGSGRPRWRATSATPRPSPRTPTSTPASSTATSRAARSRGPRALPQPRAPPGRHREGPPGAARQRLTRSPVPGRHRAGDRRGAAPGQAATRHTRVARWRGERRAEEAREPRPPHDRRVPCVRRRGLGAAPPGRRAS